MRNFLTKLLTLLLFILSAGCLYLAVTACFPNFFVNIVLFVIAIFVLLQACGNIDKENGYGKYARPEGREKQHNTQNNSNPTDEEN